PYGYRNKMEFTIANEPPSIGLHAAERYDVVLDIERCLLQSEPMNALLDEFRRQVRERALAVYDPVTERGLLRFVMMREGRHTGEPWSTSSAPPPTSSGSRRWPTRCARACLPRPASSSTSTPRRRAWP